jgi:molybdopterin/thiamine biosynthesis adenylyltransferase
MKIVIIGLGGIGSFLSELISKFLEYDDSIKDKKIVLVDGDIYESKNATRQFFNHLQAGENKAAQKQRELSYKYRSIEFSYISTYVNISNIGGVIQEKDVVFLCVDNHKTRRVVSDYCSSLQNILLISGGNELTDGNVHIYFRRNGESITPSLIDYNSEILNSDDRSPEEMSCEELSQSLPQLLFTNVGAATIMCWAFYSLIKPVKFVKVPSIIYFDIMNLSVIPKIREVKTKN